MSAVYLDYNASSPLDPRVADVMFDSMRSGLGNPASAHSFGRRQAAATDDARDLVAQLVGGWPGGVVFTSGATEANNLALRGLAEGSGPTRRRVLVSAVEHASVLETAARLEEQNIATVGLIPVTRAGVVDLSALESMLAPDVLAVSVMAANSETGILNPIAEVASLAHSVGALVHCDATQALGRVPFDQAEVGADFVSLSGHKFCGPGGTGALVGTRRSLPRLTPVLHGGGQERGLRSGSLNVVGIVGLGAAAGLAVTEGTTDAERVAVLRDRLVALLMARLPEVEEIGDPARRLPNTASIRFVGADAEAVVVNSDPVAFSTGSACSSGSIEPSRVLTAMGLDQDEAFEVVRFSAGRFTRDADISAAAEITVTAVEYVRHMTREAPIDAARRSS